LIEGGAQRKDAYEAVQRNAMQAWEGARQGAPGVGGWNRGGADFKELVSKDPLITKYLTPDQIESCFDPTHYLRHMDAIYRRVFGMDERQGKRRMARTRKQRG
jgi:adenylosuccinate lyase